MSCGVGHRYGLDLALLWLWRRQAAIALIQPPSLGTSTCRECGPKKQKKKNPRNTNYLKQLKEIENLNRSFTRSHQYSEDSKEEHPRIRWCSMKSLKQFILKFSRKGTISNSFYQAIITLKPEPVKGITRKENWRSIYESKRNSTQRKIWGNQIQ